MQPVLLCILLLTCLLLPLFQVHNDQSPLSLNQPYSHHETPLGQTYIWEVSLGLHNSELMRWGKLTHGPHIAILIAFSRYSMEEESKKESVGRDIPQRLLKTVSN
ncbi:hypothetical protein BDR05DRAFT_943324 [Suillus weaverae]|nr:hypothetical protein BDR05DRAFT_943324 [Suillus weaverae]